ncbi:MAG: 7-carboxy-7-deazaguanine synthase QueE [Spirochaetaceae bacterium]|nr:7-carboxy-7-deazaguanine synthase QueE [Myxococcales bacterium]MCB9726198.1 7-carboxy-7-deazaguanine synthase QueE [Spirochaetaceae bacterium]HPG25136.1 7-carboxy-7-deazaguanine synthase QueE [Myxococcota bacterium]
MGAEASLVEIFVSAQGEGPEVGRTTVFVRFGGCDLRCGWCDSPGTWRPGAVCRLEVEAGRGVFEERANPLPIDVVVEHIERLAPRRSTWISLTGGEPLLQPDAVEAVVDRLHAAGRRIYLETHGLHAAALARMVERIDLVSMDWKLASDVQWGPRVTPLPGEDFHDAHAAFLRVARRARAVYVKVVVTPSTRDAELDAMLDRIAAIDPSTPLVIQPVTPTGSVRERPDADRLLGWLARAESRLADVRLVPQTHPIYGAR